MVALPAHLMYGNECRRCIATMDKAGTRQIGDHFTDAVLTLSLIVIVTAIYLLVG